MPRIDKGGALRLQGVGRRLQDLVEHVRREPAAGGRRSLGGGAVLRRARVVPRGGGAGAETLRRRVRHLFARGGRSRTAQATRVARALLLGESAARRERANRGSGERRGAGEGRRAESEQVAGSARVVRLRLSPGSVEWEGTTRTALRRRFLGPPMRGRVEPTTAVLLVRLHASNRCDWGAWAVGRGRGVPAPRELRFSVGCYL